MDNQDRQEDQKLVSKRTIIFDTLLTLVFFTIMAFVLRAFVPMQGKGVTEFWAAFAAIPLAGIFWILVQMFRVTLTDQLRRSKKAK
jgi:hypothetical protein